MIVTQWSHTHSHTHTLTLTLTHTLSHTHTHTLTHTHSQGCWIFQFGGGAAPHASVEAEIFICRREGGGRRGWMWCCCAVARGTERKEAVCVCVCVCVCWGGRRVALTLILLCVCVCVCRCVSAWSCSEDEDATMMQTARPQGGKSRTNDTKRERWRSQDRHCRENRHVELRGWRGDGGLAVTWCRVSCFHWWPEYTSCVQRTAAESLIFIFLFPCGFVLIILLLSGNVLFFLLWSSACRIHFCISQRHAWSHQRTYFVVVF